MFGHAGGVTTNINGVLDGHVTLEVECVDRVLLNVYVPNLQVSGQVVLFLTRHLGNPIPSPALFSQIGDRFVRAVKAFAAENGIPVLRVKGPDRSRWDDRKIDHVGPYVDAAERENRFGLVAIVAAPGVPVGVQRPEPVPDPGGRVVRVHQVIPAGRGLLLLRP